MDEPLLLYFTVFVIKGMNLSVPQLNATCAYNVTQGSLHTLCMYCTSEIFLHIPD